jgi:hypothetical protein
MQIETADVKHNLKSMENILLAEVLLRSLKGNQNNKLLPSTIRSNQRNLFQSASSYSKALGELLNTSTKITNQRMDNVTVIIELLNEINSNADYVIQNLLEFLRVLVNCSNGNKIDSDKYAALLQYFITEVQNEYNGKETTLVYNKEEHSLKQLKTPKEKIYGT